MSRTAENWANDDSNQSTVPWQTLHSFSSILDACVETNDHQTSEQGAESPIEDLERSLIFDNTPPPFSSNSYFFSDPHSSDLHQCFISSPCFSPATPSPLYSDPYFCSFPYSSPTAPPFSPDLYFSSCSSSSPTPTPNSEPPFLTILSRILSQFYLEKKPTAEIDDNFLTQGTFLTPSFIQRVVGTSTCSPKQLINMSEADAQKRIEERTRMMEFIQHLRTSGRKEMYSTNEIQGLCWLNGYFVDEEFVKDFVTNEWIYSG